MRVSMEFSAAVLRAVRPAFSSAQPAFGAPARGVRACVAWCRCSLNDGRIVVHRTMEKSRFQRTADGQRQNIQACSPSAMEKKIIWARPMMFWNGT